MKSVVKVYCLKTVHIIQGKEMFYKTLVIFSLIYTAVAVYDEETDTIVTLPNLGSIQGKIIETAWSHREVLQFVDVKYAESPSGKYRFKVFYCC